MTRPRAQGSRVEEWASEPHLTPGRTFTSMPSGSCRHRSPGKDTPGGGEASRQQEEPSFRSQEALVPAFPGLFRSLAALGTSLTLLASPPGPGGTAAEVAGQS